MAGRCAGRVHGAPGPDHNRVRKTRRQALHPRSVHDGLRCARPPGVRHVRRRPAPGLPGSEARRHPGLPRVRRRSRTAAGCTRRKVKLLLDRNLSPRLRNRSRDIRTAVVPVRSVGSATADAPDVRAYSRQHVSAIVPKDSDFSSPSSLHGAPPKVVRPAVGNGSVREIERRPHDHREESIMPTPAVSSDGAGAPPGQAR